MGVYIPGMKMPKNCSKCRDSGLKFAIDELGLKCPERKELWGPTEAERKGIRRPDCPLVPVPLHGRLGDLDELVRQFPYLNNFDSGNITMTMVAIRNRLYTAPTIIEAEEDSANE